jgi:hypothetical protein
MPLLHAKIGVATIGPRGHPRPLGGASWLTPAIKGGDFDDVYMFSAKSENFPAVGGGVWVGSGLNFFIFFFRLKRYKKD